MPGKDGRLPKDNRSLNSLVRLLHRTHHRLFDGLPRSDGFVLDVEVNSTLSNHHQTIVLPPLSGDDMRHGATMQRVVDVGTHAARELHSTRNSCHGAAEKRVVSSSTHAARELHSTRNDCPDHTPHSESGSSCHLHDVGPTEPLLNDAARNLGATASTFSSSRVCNAHLTLSSCYWSWWRSLPATAAPSTARPYVRARKFLHGSMFLKQLWRTSLRNLKGLSYPTWTGSSSLIGQ